MNASLIQSCEFEKDLTEVEYEVANGLQNPKIVAEPHKINLLQNPTNANRVSGKE